MITECQRCGGHGGLCPKCGRWRSLMKTRRACSCGSRAQSRPCPGFVAGVMVKRGIFRDQEHVPTASAPHFATFAVCDCCGIRANGFGGSLPPTWFRVPKGHRPELHLCEECNAQHGLLVTMALEQLFVDREQMNAGIGWRGVNPPKLLHPVPPSWVREGGQVVVSEDPLTLHGIRIHPGNVRVDQVKLYQGTNVLITIDGVAIPDQGFIPFLENGEPVTSQRDGAALRLLQRTDVEEAARADVELAAEHALQLLEDIEGDAARIVEGINAPPR